MNEKKPNLSAVQKKLAVLADAAKYDAAREFLRQKLTPNEIHWNEMEPTLFTDSSSGTDKTAHLLPQKN